MASYQAGEMATTIVTPVVKSMPRTRLGRAGIQRGGDGKCSAGACPPLPADPPPTLVPSHRIEDPQTGAPIVTPSPRFRQAVDSRCGSYDDVV